MMNKRKVVVGVLIAGASLMVSVPAYAHDSEHHDHGTKPSVKGPGYTKRDPTELCDTYDEDGNGDDLCPPVVVEPVPDPIVPPVPETIPPVVVSQPEPTAVAVPVETVTPVTPEPELPKTGGDVLPLALLGVGFIGTGGLLIRRTKVA